MDNMNLVSDMIGSILDSLPRPDYPVSFIPSGFPSLDQLTNGLETSSLITVIARPGMGKTSFALDLASYAGMLGRKVIYFSYEMSKDEILFRLLSKLSFVPASYIRLLSQSDDDTEWQRLITAAEALYKTKIYINNNPANTVEDIREICSQIDNIGLICVDYFQLVGSRACYPTAKDVSSYVSRMLKRTAEENKAPVICLAQLPRSVEKRADKRPVLADLEGIHASMLALDSDVVIGLYRDAYYNFGSPRNWAEAIILKNNWGALGTAKLGWNDVCASFYTVKSKL